MEIVKQTFLIKKGLESSDWNKNVKIFHVPDDIYWCFKDPKKSPSTFLLDVFLQKNP